MEITKILTYRNLITLTFFILFEESKKRECRLFQVMQKIPRYFRPPSLLQSYRHVGIIETTKYNHSRFIFKNKYMAIMFDKFRKVS